jgi:hypothetical protein
MSRVFQAALGMAEPSGRFEVEDFAVKVRKAEVKRQKAKVKAAPLLLLLPFAFLLLTFTSRSG